MKIVKPSYEILDQIDGQAILKKLELIGRVSHKSEDRITETSAAPFVKKIIELGDESVLEHVSITVRFICDRGVSHELVRHRLASYTQSSTRYCNYSQDKFGNEITVIQPCFLTDMTQLDDEYPIASKGYFAKDLHWYSEMSMAENAYFAMLDAGAKPEEARSVLPNSLKTEVIMTANLRELRHILQLRCSKSAHPQIRELMVPLLHELQAKIPVVFDDIAERIREQNE
jgi:thymidylate synthase (FAD)